ncbi:MAG: CapA family protein [Myxococcales bacterium]|nr:CapA family protein [Myxococcales bacterium]
MPVQRWFHQPMMGGISVHLLMRWLRGWGGLGVWLLGIQAYAGPPSRSTSSLRPHRIKPSTSPTTSPSCKNLSRVAPASLPSSRGYEKAPFSGPFRDSLLFVGDLMLARRVALPKSSQRKAIRGLWGDVGWVIGNLETPMGPCLGKSTARYPRLCTDLSRLRALRDVGVHAVTLANNHMMDAGVAGLKRTRQTLRQMGILVSEPTPLCGSQEGLQLLRLCVRGKKIWVLAINAVRPRFPPKGFPTLPTPAEVERCVKRLSSRAVVVASVHVGVEYRRQPISWDASYLRAAWKGGARAVVAHHPHVTRDFLVWRGVPWAWGLGNAVSDQRYPIDVREGMGLFLRVSGKMQPFWKDVAIRRFRIVEGWPRRVKGP